MPRASASERALLMLRRSTSTAPSRTPPAAAAHADSTQVITGSLGGTSDFVFRGLSLTRGKPATLASEYPDRLQQLWDRAPEYMDRGNELMAAISRIAQRVADLPIGNAGARFREMMEEG